MTTGTARIVHRAIGGEETDVSVLTAFQGDEVFVETKAIDFGTDRFNKSLACLVFDITGAGSIDSVQCYVGYSQRLKDGPTWTGPYSLSDQDATLWLKLPESRYFYLKFVDLLPEVQWKLSQITAYGRINDGQGRGPRGKLSS